MKKILGLLKYINNFGYEAYIVGGFVRDNLLNRTSLDVDICTSASYDELKIILPDIKKKDLFCNLLVIGEYNVEITTYRLERNYNGRRPLNIEYTNSLVEDLKRRDFTINTICMDKDGKIIDLLGGIEDLNNKIIRCVGNADKKIEEDYLRILRAIRFATTLDFDLDVELIRAIEKNKESLNELSSFRKRKELDKIVYGQGLYLIKKLGLEQELGISIPNIVKYYDDVIATYSQCDIKIDNFFTKSELKKYNLLKEYSNKYLSNYDLFMLGKENIDILNIVRDDNILERYNNLKIKDVRDLDTNLSKLDTDTKNKIVKAILDGKLENNSFSIANFITNIF